MSRRLAVPLSIGLLALANGLLSACGDSRQRPAPIPPGGREAEPATPTAPERAALRIRSKAIFGVLPEQASSEANPITAEKIELGRILYYDPRLSKNHDISCNSCHLLDGFGVDGEPTSKGHKGQRGGRNAPTVYNAAFHIAQFWDGRAADVEAQAKGPVLNPTEMAMPSEHAVLALLN